MVFVFESLFELGECHGFVGFLNVLGNSPHEEEVLHCVFHAPDGSLGFISIFGL